MTDFDSKDSALEATLRNERALWAEKENSLQAQVLASEKEAASLTSALKGSRSKIEILEELIREAGNSKGDLQQQESKKIHKHAEETERLRSQISVLEEEVSMLQKQLELSKSALSLAQEEVKHEQAK